MSQNKICPKCRTENPAEANFCRHCGSQFNDTPKILSFMIEPVCHVGDDIKVVWNVENCDNVTLNGKDVTGLNKITVNISEKCELMLSACNGTKKVTRSLNIIPQVDAINVRSVSVGNVLKKRKRYISVVCVLIVCLLLLFLLFLKYESLIHHFINVSYGGWNTLVVSLYIFFCISLLMCVLVLVGLIYKYYKHK